MCSIHKEGIRLGFKRENQVHGVGVGVQGVHIQRDILPRAGIEEYTTAAKDGWD